MTSLNELRLKLVQFDSAVKEERLEGKSFSLTRNNKLGIPGFNAYHVPIPYAPGASKTGHDTPSALASAGIDALKAGLENVDTSSVDNRVFIDIAHLGDSSAQEANWMKLFISKGDHQDSMYQTLVKLVNVLPSKYTPIIRFLNGLPGNAQADTEFQGYQDFLAGFNRPGTQIHIGYYQPSFDNTQLKNETNESVAVQQLLIALAGGILKVNTGIGTVLLGGILFELQHALDRMIPTVSWNHAKILAVNGHILLTGGANYDKEYADGVDAIVDMQAGLQGDAALTAHKYCDYFWEYLNKSHVPDKKSFKRSFTRGGPSNQWTPDGQATVPLSDYTANPKAVEDKSVLSVGKLGDWVGPTFDFNFPVQFVDAARDVLLNILYQMCQKKMIPDEPKSIEAYMDSMPDKDLKRDFDGHKVWPAAWASRIARNEAISQAKKTIRMSLQAIATNDANKHDEYMKAVGKVNETLKGLKWDGVLWPLDSLFALSKFMNSAPDTKVSIILSGSKSGPVAKNSSGYEDDFSVKDIRNYMQPFCHPPQGEDFESWFNDKVGVKRMWNDQKANHSKVICIDPTEAQSLLYIGSDNPHPNYNEEFGVWIEDKETIKT